MIDKMYLQNVIAKIEAEVKEHDEKFASSPVHKDCQTRFAKTLEKLREELAKLGDNS